MCADMCATVNLCVHMHVGQCAMCAHVHVCHSIHECACVHTCICATGCMLEVRKQFADFCSSLLPSLPPFHHTDSGTWVVRVGSKCLSYLLSHLTGLLLLALFWYFLSDLELAMLYMLPLNAKILLCSALNAGMTDVCHCVSKCYE